MAKNIIANTVKSIFVVWEETKTVGQVARKNKLKTAIAVLAVLPFCGVLAVPFVLEYRRFTSKRKEYKSKKESV